MSKKKSPSFQFYYQDFMFGTFEMTAEEVGGYIRLLCHQWDKGFIENNDKKIQNLTGISKKSIQGVKQKFDFNDDGNLINKQIPNRIEFSEE